MNNPPLILIVDDEENFLEIFSTRLTQDGFKVETAKNGEEGYAFARKMKPDLILMDMEMPGLNGAATVMKLKNDPDTKEIRVIFLTNYGDPRAEMRAADIHFSEEIGADAYLRKTDDLGMISDKVKSFFALYN